MRCLSLLTILLISLQSIAQQLPPSEFEKRLSDTSNQLLDVRTMGEYTSAHLKSALQADWNNQEQFKNRVEFLDKEKPLYVYCAVGGRSKNAAQWFRSNGFKEVYELQGGLVKWKAENKPVEGMPDKKPMSLADYQQALKQFKLVLVDIGAEYCAPCRAMAPVVSQLQKTLPANSSLLKIDAAVETNVLTTTHATEFPTFILYKNGNEVWRKQGVATLGELTDAIQKHQ